MSVVLRCPTCGTTQAHVGECEACSEGEVQYFCTNHDQGIWLDSPVCGRCAAKFGDPPRKPPAPRAPTGPTPLAGAPDFRPPGGRRRTERPPDPDFSRRPPRRSELEEAADPEVSPPALSLGELIEEIAEQRARARGRHEAEEVPWVEAGPRRPGFPLAGCLVRLGGLLFLLIAAAIIFLFLLFGGVIVG